MDIILAAKIESNLKAATIPQASAPIRSAVVSSRRVLLETRRNILRKLAARMKEESRFFPGPGQDHVDLVEKTQWGPGL